MADITSYFDKGLETCRKLNSVIKNAICNEIGRKAESLWDFKSYEFTWFLDILISEYEDISKYNSFFFLQVPSFLLLIRKKEAFTKKKKYT